MNDFSLIETLRWQPDEGFIRLRLHLQIESDYANRINRQIGLDSTASQYEIAFRILDHVDKSLFRMARVQWQIGAARFQHGKNSDHHL